MSSVGTGDWHVGAPPDPRAQAVARANASSLALGASVFDQRTNVLSAVDAGGVGFWEAQLPQIGIPFMGLPGLVVSTGLVGKAPVGVQIVSGRYREDLCLLAGEAIEAGGVPPSPIDPVG